jgi:hypothetical protein
MDARIFRMIFPLDQADWTFSRVYQQGNTGFEMAEGAGAGSKPRFSGPCYERPMLAARAADAKDIAKANKTRG